jgi:hypothetical protein
MKAPRHGQFTEDVAQRKSPLQHAEGSERSMDLYGIQTSGRMTLLACNMPGQESLPANVTPPLSRAKRIQSWRLGAFSHDIQLWAPSQVDCACSQKSCAGLRHPWACVSDVVHICNAPSGIRRGEARRPGNRRKEKERSREDRRTTAQ